MSSLSTEAIIAIVAAVAACSPFFVIVIRRINRYYQDNRHNQLEGQDIERATPTNRENQGERQDIELATPSNRNLQIVRHVKHTILRPGLAYFPRG